MSLLRKYQDPFLQILKEPLLEASGITLRIKRTDLIHPDISGNKWYKLSGSLSGKHLGGDTLVATFGGAYSNHIYATAAACSELGVRSLAFVRGERTVPLNPTLRFASEHGMELRYVPRSRYRDKESLAESIEEEFGNVILLPEGGTTEAGIRACAGIVDEQMADCDIVCIPAGTGGTIAGVIGGLNGRAYVLGFSALKGDFLKKEVSRWLNQLWPDMTFDRWEIDNSYHFGGYAKFDDVLIAFIQQFYQRHGILLDPVYTGKMMFGIYDKIRTGVFKPGTSICAIHTGGLQGWAGFTERFGIDPTSF